MSDYEVANSSIDRPTDREKSAELTEKRYPSEPLESEKTDEIMSARTKYLLNNFKMYPCSRPLRSEVGKHSEERAHGHPKYTATRGVSPPMKKIEDHMKN